MPWAVFFKSCPELGSNVQITDPRWPSLREAARRFLRTEGCNLQVSPENIKEANEIVQAIADHIPARLNLPVISVGLLSSEGLFQIGAHEPEIDICCVPDATWTDFKSQVIELLEAGYPGCIGCGGPGSEGVWNESARRQEMLGN